MESRHYVLLLSVIMAGFLLSAQAYDFYVGGKDGWVVKPSESYVQWSQRNRFQISDSLVFRYNKGTDSVLVVSKQDYDTCNVSNPILKLDGGYSTYKFARSGKFYFITGNQSNCQAGQKLATVVISPRTPKSPPSTVPSMAPVGTTPGTPAATAPSTVPSSAPISSPPTPTRSHGMTPPSSPSTSPPAPSVTGPISSPSIAPMSPPSLVPSNAPASLSPEGSPYASPPSPPGVSPSVSPSYAPSISPGMAPSSPFGMEPSSSPGSGPPAIPGGDVAPAGSPGGSGNSIAPTAHSSAPAIIFSNKFALGLCLLVTVAFKSSVVSF